MSLWDLCSRSFACAVSKNKQQHQLALSRRCQATAGLIARDKLSADACRAMRSQICASQSRISIFSSSRENYESIHSIVCSVEYLIARAVARTVTGIRLDFLQIFKQLSHFSVLKYFANIIWSYTILKISIGLESFDWFWKSWVIHLLCIDRYR